MKKKGTIRNKCVELAKKICRKKANYTCFYCGKRKPQVTIHAHHIYNEGCHTHMACSLDNLIAVCFSHHSSDWNSKEPSFHKNPQEMADIMNEKYPERMKRLKLETRKQVLCDEQFWKNKLEELQKEYKELEKNDDDLYTSIA